MSVVNVSSFPPAELFGRLEEDGLAARLLVDDWGLGLDHRLQVSAPDARARVELLGPLADLRDPPQWHAVRVGDGERAVWCGPMRTCDVQMLRRFVLDLLTLSLVELHARWQRLG